ncbi:hypothetical protein HDU80_002766 [Chytriomyces hyalinus]|nr:hypothetical protein HDU80_002766 [Chytriomyces hyalinus]
MAKKRRASTNTTRKSDAANSDSDSEKMIRRSDRGIDAITRYEQVMDSEDEFHDQRDAIAVAPQGLHSGLLRKKKGVYIDDDDEADEQVLGLDIDDSDASNDEDEDLGDLDERELDALDAEDDRFLAKSNRMLKTGRDYMDDEDEDDELIDRETVGGTLKTRPKKGKTDDDDDAVLAWGRSRKSFYDRDEEVEDDEEAAREELAETLKLQARRIEGMDEADFFDDDDDEIAPSRKSKKETYGDSLMKRLRGTATDSAVEDAEESGAVSIETVDTGVKKEALAKMDASALKELAASQIPDVVHYLSEFEERWSEVKTVLGPTLKWMKESDDDIDEDLIEAKEYLELKYGLLLTYLTNILFYLAIRSNPPSNLTAAQVKAHPVTKVISNLSKTLGRLEKRVEGRIDKKEEELKKKSKKSQVQNKEEEPSGGFVNLLDRIADFVEARIDGEEEEYDEEDGEADGFLNESDNDDSFEDIDDDQEDAEAMDEGELQRVLASLNKPKPSTAKAPSSAKPKDSKKKVAPVPVASDEESDDDFQIPKFVSTKPEPVKGASKKAKAALAAKQSDFGETDLNEVDMSEKMNRKRDLQFHVKRIDQAISKRAKVTGGTGDEDIPLRDKFGKLVQQQKRETASKQDAGDVFSQRESADADDDLFEDAIDDSALDGLDFDADDLAELEDFDSGEGGSRKRSRGADDENDDDNDDEDEEEDENLAYYNKIASGKKAVKDDKEANFEAYKKSLERDGLYDNDLVEEGVKRATGWTIDANKGLTPRRKKEDRNSRVKIKNKFAKKQKKLSSIKAIVKDKSKLPAYRGELTGIKSSLTKSVKF